MILIASSHAVAWVSPWPYSIAEPPLIVTLAANVEPIAAKRNAPPMIVAMRARFFGERFEPLLSKFMISIFVPF